jgi:hypothetical protein
MFLDPLLDGPVDALGRLLASDVDVYVVRPIRSIRTSWLTSSKNEAMSRSATQSLPSSAKLRTVSTGSLALRPGRIPKAFGILPLASAMTLRSFLRVRLVSQAPSKYYDLC